MLMLGALAFVALSPKGYSQPLFNDDFESYADDPSLKVVWANSSAPASGSLPTGNGVTLSTSRNMVPSGGTKCGYTLYAHEMGSATLSSAITPGTPDNPTGPHALLSFWMWRNSISASAGQIRCYARIGGAAGSVKMVGAGWFNNATGPVVGTTHDVFDATTFQGYCRPLGSGSDSLFNLNNPGCPRRTVGWHKFDVELMPDGSTRYYIDNVFGRTVTNLCDVWTYINAGFGTTSGTPPAPGEEVDFDGFLVTQNGPQVTTQPANLLASAGASASFSVVATAPTGYDITGYQWYFATNLSTTAIYSTNYHAIAGATTATYTIPSASSANQGQYFVIVSNSDSYIGSASASLTITAPSILAQPPTNQTVLQGGNFTLTTTADGAPTLKYQWFKGGSAISGATTNSYTKTGLASGDAANYYCRVTNTYGAAYSATCAVSIVTYPSPSAMNLLWTKLPGAFTWLNTDGTQRGLAYNALSNHVLVVSRTGSALVHVLDGDTGNELWTLQANPASGGTYTLNEVAVADDGAVYVCNLTLDGVGTAFEVDRYADDNASTSPTVAYSGDPGAGVSDRWGDTLAARGSNTSTVILVTSRGNGAPGNGTNFCILTTVDGANFSGTVIHTTAGKSDLGIGANFGQGNTIWAKSNDGDTRGLYHIQYNLGDSSSIILANYTNFSAGVPALSAAVGNVAVNPAGNFLAATAIEAPNDLRLYDITDPTAGPTLLDWEFFTPNNAGQATGAIAFANRNGKTRVYALNSNNGIVAATINWPPISITPSGSSVILTWPGAYVLQSAAGVSGPYNDVIGAHSGYTTSASTMQFYRLRSPP